MTENSAVWTLASLAVIALIVSTIFTIQGAIDCGNRGGEYIIPKNQFPVCVQGVK